MSKSPIPLRDVLNYLRLEDAEELVPGSVKYVGHAIVGRRTMHFWSYPLDGRIRWACLDGNSLGDAEVVPSVIRAKTLPLEMHRVQRSPAPSKRPWRGSNIPQNALPKWVPSSKVRVVDTGYVAAFLYNFDRAAAIFGAKPTTDNYHGGAGPSRFFLLELSRNKLAMLECEQRRPDRINLYLPEKEGRVYWEDYHQVMDALGVPLEKAFRQGGLKWKHRKPTPKAIKRTRDHDKKMWIPGPAIIWSEVRGLSVRGVFSAADGWVEVTADNGLTKRARQGKSSAAEVADRLLRELYEEGGAEA